MKNTNNPTYPSHYEIYKGRDISVQVSAHLSSIDVDRELPDYMPRIVVTEHSGADFKDREVINGHSYPTPDECIAQGLKTAHAYIDKHA